MRKRSPGFFSELPAASDYNPVKRALEKTDDSEIAAALRLFTSMPRSTSVFANPVRYRHQLACNGEVVQLDIRSFTIRGCLLEEDIVSGSADAVRTIFVGLFGRFDRPGERRIFSRILSDAFAQAANNVLVTVGQFTHAFPNAGAEVCAQHVASIRKAKHEDRPLNTSTPPAELLCELIRIHVENAAVAACSSHMRAQLRHRPKLSASTLVRNTREFLEITARDELFRRIFSLLLHRTANSVESRVLENLGAIQIHHGSAGSNMVARYLASLHTKSISDLFTAAQMTLDCGRHFGAITTLTDFVAELEKTRSSNRDERIRQRAIRGDLPTFGHPEIAAAGRANRIEVDPRPAIYLHPLFEAIERGLLPLSRKSIERIEIVQRMYQLAFVEGIEKPGRAGRLRILPNTDFGAWIVQEALGIHEMDRTLLSYIFRGFGWMMDVREQLQQAIIRPVIAPDPAIVPAPSSEGAIAGIVDAVHDRLCRPNAFAGVLHPKTISREAAVRPNKGQLPAAER